MSALQLSDSDNLAGHFEVFVSTAQFFQSCKQVSKSFATY
jgi:hypothetical protein